MNEPLLFRVTCVVVATVIVWIVFRRFISPLAPIVVTLVMGSLLLIDQLSVRASEADEEAIEPQQCCDREGGQSAFSPY